MGRNIPLRPLALLEGTTRISVFLRFAESSKEKRDVKRIFLPTATSLREVIVIISAIKSLIY